MIRNWLEYAAALNIQTTINECKPTGPTVTCDWRYVEDCSDRRHGQFWRGRQHFFTVKEGKISGITVAPNPARNDYKWAQAFMTWLGATNPTEHALAERRSTL